MRTHLYITATIFLVAGAAAGIVGLAGLILLPDAVARLADSATDDALLAASLMELTGRMIVVGAAVVTPPCLICGVAILRRRGWSRWIGIPIAAAALVFVPVGTVLGGYVLWVLLSERFEPWFEAASPDGN